MLKKLSDAEKRTLDYLLYLVTHDEHVNNTVISHYGKLRIGNPGLGDPQEFKAGGAHGRRSDRVEGDRRREHVAARPHERGLGGRDQAAPRSDVVRGTDTGIRLTLVDAKAWTDANGRCYRREQWTIVGGEVDPTWRRVAVAGWEPSSRFALYVVDGEVNPRLASYGGDVWPTAWPALFRPLCRYKRGIEITDEGLMFRAAALCGASDMYADARLS